MIDYFNGKYIEQKEDFHFEKMAWNNGFFTTLKVVNENIINFDQHLKRLENSFCSNNLKFPSRDFRKIIEELIFRNRLKDARIKIMLFGYKKQISVWVKCLELTLNREPKVLEIFEQKRRMNKKYSFKSINYSENIFLNKEAKKNKFDDYLFIDSDNRILETTFCNIFFVNDTEIVTPFSNLAILPGTIRGKLLELDRCKDFKIVEKEIFINELEKYRYVFTTNSIHDLVSVKKIGFEEFEDSQEIIEMLLAKI